MTDAVARLADAVSGGALGTAFAVTNRWALTAFHCVGDRQTHEIRVRRVRLEWDHGDVSDALVDDGDPFLDIALLHLDRALPRELAPIRLVRKVTEESLFEAPGAVPAVAEVPIFRASGEITWPNAHLVDEAPVIQLTCRQAAAELSLQGLSGAPVIVRRSGGAVGVIRRNPPRPDRPELAAGATVYATPVEAILAQWPRLQQAGALLGSDPLPVIQHLAGRSGARTETTLRASVRQLLLVTDLGLDESDLRDAPGRLLDVERGRMIIGVTKDLRKGDATRKAERELDPCLESRGQQTGERFTGVITDGAEWRLYHRVNGELRAVDGANFIVDPASPERLLTWLEAVLATGKRIRPTPDEITLKLGAGSPAYALNAATLAGIYARYRDEPLVKVRRDLWAKLLTTASGRNFTDDDSLFVDHTLLAAMAKVIGHAVLGFLRPGHNELTAASIMSGTEFSAAQIGGVIEADFFNWLTDLPDGEQFIRDLARRLTRFAWDHVEHDVMKLLYESIIPEEVRHSLGEYYTPDWLAEYIIDECVDDPLHQRVLDASCGSGTFLFHAIRRYVARAEAAGRSAPDIVSDVGERVIGFDVHPVAVTLARVTYLLAIGMERLRHDDRPAFTVPVYLCDSIRWGQDAPLWSYEGLSIRTNTDHSALLYDLDYPDRSELTDRLRFPDRVVANSNRFDRLVAELADLATGREPGSPVPSLGGIFRRFDVHTDDRTDLKQTFAKICDLHDQGKDHIWGYYVRNLARPVWLARPDNRVDVLVGNPPWLSYRFMTEIQKALFRDMSKERGLWAGAHVATNQDLSALFVARCIELFLRPGGRFGYVMPLASLSRKAYAGFRAGTFPVQHAPVRLAFDRPWDLHKIKPIFFRQAVGAIFGRRQVGSGGAVPLDQVPEVWSGRFSTKRASRVEATAHVSRIIGEQPPAVRRDSPYAKRFSQGATVVPRFLLTVEPDTNRPFGAGAGRRAVVSRRSVSEKRPWKDLPSLRGTVEQRFVRPLFLGESILPFRPLRPIDAIIPWDQHLLNGSDLDEYPGLATWLRRAEALWVRFRSSERLSLIERLDYQRYLSRQFPTAGYRVVYTKSGMYMAAAIVADQMAIIDHKLYWGAVDSLDEGRFLTAILNSTVLTLTVRHLQGRGEHNPRDFDKYIFQLPVPVYKTADPAHQRLVALAERAEHVAANIPLPAKRFEVQRRCIREALAHDGVMSDIDAIVKTLFA